MSQTLVDLQQATVASADTVQVTLNSTGAGRLMLTTNIVTLSIADTVGGSATGNTWTKRVSRAGSSAQEIWDCLSPVTVGINHVITCLAGGPTLYRVIAAAFSGPPLSYVASSSVDDSGNQATTSPACASSINGGAAQNFYWTGLSTGIFWTITDFSINSSFIIHANAKNLGAAALSAAYLNQTGAAATNPSWTWTPASRFTPAMAAYSEAAAVSPVLRLLCR